MKFIENIEPKKYEEFIYKNADSSFLQTVEWGELKADKGIDYYLVGVIDDNAALLAAGIIHYFKGNKIKNMYCPRGPVIDYANEQVITCFLDGVYEFGKKLKADVVDIEPNYIIRHLDSKFQITKENADISEFFKKNGFVHRGLNGQIPGFQLRYTVAFDLSKSYEEYFKNFTNEKKRIINRNEKYFKIKLVEGTADEIADLIRYREQLSLKKHFYVDERPYFEKCFNLFKDKHDVKYIRAIADFEEMLSTIKKEIELLVEQKANSKNNAKDLENQIQSLEQKIKDIKKYVKEKNINGSACVGVAMALYVNGNITYLYEHTDKELGNFGVPTLMINYVLKNGILNKCRNFDLLGIINPNFKENPNISVNSFKTSFGGEVIEYIGIFSKSISRLYKGKIFLKKIYYRLRGSIYKD